MQVIEKVKVVPEGYNGAGMDGYNRRDVNGKANAGLTSGSKMMISMATRYGSTSTRCNPYYN